MDAITTERTHQKELLMDEQFISVYRKNNDKAIVDDGLWSDSQKQEMKFAVQPVVNYCKSVLMEAMQAYEQHNLPEATFHNRRLNNLIGNTLRFQATKALHNTFQQHSNELSENVRVRTLRDFDENQDTNFLDSFRSINSDKIKRNEEVDQFRMYQRNGDLLGCLYKLGGAHDREKLNMTGYDREKLNMGMTSVDSYCRNIEKKAIRAMKSGDFDEARAQLAREFKVIRATYHPSGYATPDVPKSAFEQRPDALGDVFRMEPKSRNAAIEKWLDRLRMQEQIQSNVDPGFEQ